MPPPLITANRTRLLSLIAANFFGQNSPAIAATEADYERMWAQDAAAMHSYAAASSAASKLTPFTEPPAVAVQPTTQALGPLELVNSLLAIPALTSAAASTSSSSFSGAAMFTTNHALFVNGLRDESLGIGPFLASASGASTPTLAAPQVSAAMGRASLVNTLSVPQAWAATTTPPVSPATTPATKAASAPTASTAVQPGMFGEAMLGTLAGRGVNNAAAKARRPSVIPRSPAAG